MQGHKRILFAGGGTAGSVTPLLAVFDELKENHTDLEFHWVGTKDGPERKLVGQRSIAFSQIPVAKIDRFFSLRNIIMPFIFMWACFKAIKILKTHQPDLIVAAGGFVAVPIVWMARFKKIPSIIHQLDVRPGLANKLMAPFAKTITVTFEKSLKDFSKKKTVWTGAPVRKDILQSRTHKLLLSADKPVILIFGGGTGALAINEMVWSALDELTDHAQIIHITGKGKAQVSLTHDDYYQYEFLADEMGEAYQQADLVVTRAGLGTMLELAALKKPAVIIPIPSSHQEDNASLLNSANAAVILDQTKLSPHIFASKIVSILKDEKRREELSANISRFYRPDAIDKMVEKIRQILYNTDS